jgi:hypothetical protein
MLTPRGLHTATLLADGKVLIVGGYTPSGSFIGLASAELYDPSTGTFTAAGNMIDAHFCHSATLLGNGKVLIAGSGIIGSDIVNGHAYGHATIAELYDLATGMMRGL